MLLPFIEEGFARGEKAFHIVDPARRDAHLQRLAAAGIDTATAQQRGQFELYNWTEAHLRDGSFDPDRMRALIEEVLTGARQQGFPSTRFVTHMEWALAARVSMTALLEYEAKANYRWLRHPDPVV
jgi:MEDS: MEthanogen/methylotroph, DcmR Sensory domain